MDDGAFTVVDSLGLSDEVLKDYARLTTAPRKRFAPTTSPFEPRFLDAHTEARSRQAKAFPDLTFDRGGTSRDRQGSVH